MLGAPQSVRQAEDRFERSLGIVHNNFEKVLQCVVKLATDIIKPVVGAESDQQVNICSFAVCCDRRWPSTQ